MQESVPFHLWGQVLQVCHPGRLAQVTPIFPVKEERTKVAYTKLDQVIFFLPIPPFWMPPTPPSDWKSLLMFPGQSSIFLRRTFYQDQHDLLQGPK